MGADARGARQVRAGTTRPASRCRRRSSRRSSASSKFNQGYATVEYLSSAIVDMELHTAARRRGRSATRSSARRSRRIGVPREVAMRHRLPQFNHLFTSDAYSAGYYSYLWSEVMDADTWEAFVEAGGPVGQGRRERCGGLHPRDRQLDRPRRGVPAVPRPRSRREGAAREARLRGGGAPPRSHDRAAIVDPLASEGDMGRSSEAMEG